MHTWFIFRTIKYSASLSKIDKNLQDISSFKREKKVRESIKCLWKTAVHILLLFTFIFCISLFAVEENKKEGKKMSSVFRYSWYSMITAVAITLINISNNILWNLGNLALRPKAMYMYLYYFYGCQ